MMPLLLDTHTFLWFVLNDPRLSGTAGTLLRDAGNQVFLSVASVWEMAIKVSIGKLPLAQPIDILIPEQLARNDFRLLPIELAHVTRVSTMPLHHRDPFDRLLAAQSLTERMPLVSGDSVLDGYGLTRLW